MLSSTSSSNQRLPSANWFAVLLGGLLIAFALIAAMELRLAARGIQPTAADNARLWAAQRARASSLGDRALILVGDSRMHVGIDLDTLRKMTGLEPVQLAIDASSFVPVLGGLANDPRVTGTVVVSFLPRAVENWGEDEIAAQYQANYERKLHHPVINATESEAVLSDWVGEHLRSYADGAAPWNSLRLRVLPAQGLPQYVVIRPDRSKLANFRLARLPDLYYERVAREMKFELQIAPDANHQEIERLLETKVAALQPSDPTAFLGHLPDVQAMVAAIQARGGHVYFVQLPTSGLVRRINERRYPRSAFWDAFAASTTAHAVDFEDVPALQAIDLPDGSHADFRNGPRLTAAVVDALGLAGGSLAKSP